MTDSETPKATLEELLRQVIEAQVKGGFAQFAGADIISIFEKNGNVHFTFNEGFSNVHILAILLNSDGAKAAWGEQEKFYSFDGVHATGQTLPYWLWVCRTIHNAWHSGSGNNVRAALETAVEFLPKK